MSSPRDDLLTYGDYAARMAVSVSTVQRWVREGTISNVRVGGRVYIHVDQVDRPIDHAIQAGKQRQRRKARRITELRRVG